MAAYLKSLELQGYKTFANRTLFEFSGRITAIVGPNGSGKSNIADAIRWVLGEQSYTVLRGRKTEDMIFAGTEQRPRAGMAMATVLFDNEDGWLPIDFNEVAIARRAYRDGQNEYLLNGQRVRLKETSELLAQSGLAERTYTIIGQGLVDAALSLKPDERRRFFEEAAGIGLYRSRREEALNRLDSTRHNLERVQDILGELEPRLQSLERQTRRAQDYDRIKADLRILMREWYGFQWHRAQQEMVREREIGRLQEAAYQQARQKLTEIEHRFNNLRNVINAIRGDLNNWHIQSSQLHQQREKLSRDLAVLEERQRVLIEQQQNQQSDLLQLEAEQRNHEERSQILFDENTRLEQEKSEAQKQLDETRKSLQTQQADRSGIEKRLEELRSKQVRAESRRVEYYAHQNELKDRFEEQQYSFKALTEAATNQAGVLKQVEVDLKQKENLRLNLDNQRGQTEFEFKDLRQKVGEKESSLKKVHEVLARTKTEKSRLQAQLDVLVQAEKSYAGLNQGARFVLELARQGKLKGNFRPLSQILSVPEELEIPIAAVIGEALDGVLFDSDSDLDQVLNLLMEAENGKTLLIPSRKLRAQEKLSIPLDEDCLGVAFDLINVPLEYQAMMQWLLGQVLIVRERAAAQRLAASLPVHVRIVTLRGEIFYGSGVVIAGREGRSGLLSRPRQKNRLQANLDNLDKQELEIEQQVLVLEQEIIVLGNQIQKQEGVLLLLNGQFSQATRDTQQASLTLQQARQLFVWQNNQLAEIKQKNTQLNNEIQLIENKITEIKIELSGLDEQIRLVHKELSSLAQEDHQSQVVFWTTSLAVATQAAQDAQRRLSEYQQVRSSNLQQQRNLQQRIQTTSLLLSELEENKLRLQTMENELLSQINSLQDKIVPTENDLNQREIEYSKIQADQAAGQQATTIAERHFAQAQMEYNRSRESLDNMRRRIEEDFGLVAFEYSVEYGGQAPLPFDGLVEQLPLVIEISPQLEENINRQRSQLRRLGAINFEAQKEYQEVYQRFEFLTQQSEDLRKADTDLRQVISELDELMRAEFQKTFNAVAVEFHQMFSRLFGGGSAHLLLTDEQNLAETGIDIEARLPGRREQGLSLLSGGERSLTAVALVFSLLKISPTPFCVLDEVDAMLDEVNVGRFCELLGELSQKTQFIVITHNRNTVQSADIIYGVTMGREGTSQIISLRLDEISDEMMR